MDDRALLEAWRGGDQDAGAELFERYSRKVYWFFRGKIDDATLEDLVQDTFEACLTATTQLRTADGFRAYLFSIARNRLINYVTRDAARAARFDPGVTSLQDLGLSPTAQLAVKERERKLLAALRELPLDLQIAVELHYFEQMSGSEIATVLGLPEGTVRTRLRAARQRLHDHGDLLDGA